MIHTSALTLELVFTAQPLRLASALGHVLIAQSEILSCGALLTFN